MTSKVQIRDGATYAPSADMKKVVAPGEFVFAAAFLDHGHIYGQANGLLNAGATLTKVYDPDPRKVKEFTDRYPQARAVDDFDQILEDPDVRLVAAAAVPCERCAIGLRVLEAGKDYFTDKSPFTTLEQLESARERVAATGRKYMVYYSERLHVETAMLAGDLIAEGAVGRVLQVLNLAPHRLAKATRPDWFFDKSKYGGILTDIGSHQFEQYLAYAGAGDATVNSARVENFSNADKPGLEDFGEASLTGDNGTSFYCRLDWFTPEGSSAWGDGRTFILGTEGTMELRKYMDVARQAPASKLFLVDGQREQEIDCKGQVGFPFFGRLILDCLHRTENAMTQAHAFKAAELSMRAQQKADEVRRG